MSSCQVIERKASSQRDWLFGPSKRTFSLSIKHGSELLPVIAESLLAYLPLIEFASGAELQNVQGREPRDLLFADTPIPYRPVGDELFFIAGDVWTDVKEKIKESFSYSVLSKFKKFQENEKIVFDKVERRSNQLVNFLSVRGLTRAIPITLNHVRFGAQHFRPRNVPLLGSSPAVFETVLVESKADKTQIMLVGVGSGGKADTFPLSSARYLELGNFLQMAFAMSLDDEWLKARNNKS